MAVRLNRIPEGQVQGIQYNGENISEILDFYFKRKEIVAIHTDSKSLQHTETIINVGDWVVNDAGMRRIVPKGQFKTLYVEKDVPEGYKRVMYGDGIT